MNNNQSPIEQFIQTLTELERTMTKGPWTRPEHGHSEGLRIKGHVCDANGESVASNGRGGNDREWIEAQERNLDGIAHLKNTNSTVIAMLKAAIQGLKGISQRPRNNHNTTSTFMATATLDCLNTLATEALGTKGEK